MAVACFAVAVGFLARFDGNADQPPMPDTALGYDMIGQVPDLVTFAAQDGDLKAGIVVEMDMGGGQ